MSSDIVVYGYSMVNITELLPLYISERIELKDIVWNFANCVLWD